MMRKIKVTNLFFLTNFRLTLTRLSLEGRVGFSKRKLIKRKRRYILYRSGWQR